MINDFLEILSAEGMPKVIDSAIALNFLMDAKAGIRNCAVALTEAATPEVRTTFQRQLEKAIDLHEEIYTLMIHKGWFYPHKVNKQFNMDVESANIAKRIASLDVFPGNTSKLKTFLAPSNYWG